MARSKTKGRNIDVVAVVASLLLVGKQQASVIDGDNHDAHFDHIIDDDGSQQAPCPSIAGASSGGTRRR